MPLGVFYPKPTHTHTHTVYREAYSDRFFSSLTSANIVSAASSASQIMPGSWERQYSLRALVREYPEDSIQVDISCDGSAATRATNFLVVSEISVETVSSSTGLENNQAIMVCAFAETYHAPVGHGILCTSDAR